MTANQISYAKYLEDQRSNLASESIKKSEVEVRSQELAESARRTNLQIESERRAQDLNVLNVQRQTEASMTSASISAGASIYASDTNRTINQMNIEAQTDVRASEVFRNKVGTVIQGVGTVINGIGSIARILAPAFK